MIAIILAGGYAKRLWPLTLNTPKPLLKVGGKPIISYILKKIEPIKDIKKVVISTNAKFEKKFRNFIKSYKTKKELKLIIEPTHAEGEKLGSIGGLGFLIKHLKIKEDALIIAGDNIFEFDLSLLLKYHKQKKSTVIALHRFNNVERVKGKYGVCVLNKNNKIVAFQEKPSKPKSLLASTACYAFTKKDLFLILKYLDEGNDADAVGNFIKWLIKKKTIYGYVFKEGWHDIGDMKEYKRTNFIYNRSLLDHL